jgi:phage terminase large subunit-like protein
MSQAVRHSKHYRARARAKTKASGEVKSSPEAMAARADFAYFCEYLTRNSPEPKKQPAHMATWNEQLITGLDSPALRGIAGPNVDILSPRGSAKSTYLAMFTAWAIGNHATQGRMLKVLYISYTIDVARPKSAAIKAIIESKEYREIFPSVIPGKKWADEYWAIDYEFAKINTIGEEVFSVCCAGLKGGIVSKRAHLIILDDLIKSEFDIASPDIREQMQYNWTRSILPTMFTGGRAICLGTRFRGDDIHCTTFIPKNRWVQIEQQAIIQNENDEEATYWDFWPLPHLEELREADPVGFSYQYQNKVIRSSENSIDPAWIDRAEVPLDLRLFDRLALGMDLSSKTQERHDYTVAVLGGRIGNKFYILDMWRGRSAGNVTKLDKVLELLSDWGAIEQNDLGEYLPTSIPIYLHAEDTAYQASLAGDFKTHVINAQKLNNIVYRPARSQGDKLMRLRSVSGLFENHLVTWNQASKLQVAVDELISFGAAPHDDCADAIAYLLNGLRASAKLDSA